MSIEIPETRREEDALREHEVEQERHEHTIAEHERHPEDNKAYHEMKEAKAVVDAKIGEAEKGDRRKEDMDAHAMTREADTELGA